MTRDYTSRGLGRARYLVAGQMNAHTTPYRNPATLRAGNLPANVTALSDLDFMKPGNRFFYTDRALLSAGQFIGKRDPHVPIRPGTFSRRAGNTILCDSGGLQFGRDPTKWEGNASP